MSSDLNKVSKEDSVFVFWAGHGFTQETEFGNLGYLVPFDGAIDESALHKNISMTILKEDISKSIPAKHVFFVMDACYSGLLATTRSAPRSSSRDFHYLKEITKESVRQVLTAGTNNQTVLDGGPNGHSVFTGRFIEALENTEDFITANEISSMVKEKVFSDARARNHTQTPRYGELFGVGDYVFVPSLENKVKNTQESVLALKKELNRLEELEKEGAKAENERARHRIELGKRAVLAKLKVEQLRQEAMEAERARKEREIKQKNEQEKALAQRKVQEEERLAMLQEKVFKKRQSLGSNAQVPLLPRTTLQEMRTIDKKIYEIKTDFHKELTNGLKQVSVRLNPKFLQAKNTKKDEFESEEEFLRRVEDSRKKAEMKQIKEVKALEQKIETEYQKQISPFINNLKSLSSKQFTLEGNDLGLELHPYNAKLNVYPVTIKVKTPIQGTVVAVSASFPIPRQEARVFKQHFENGILRSQISGNFQTTELFRVAEAYVIDDATNQKYDLFSSAFVSLGNGIIYHTTRKLYWTEDAKLIKQSLNWSAGKRACENLRVADLAGWRLPQRSEFEKLMIDLEKSPFFFKSVHSNWRFWISKPANETYGTSARVVRGDFSSDRLKHKLSVWCVRGGE